MEKAGNSYSARYFFTEAGARDDRLEKPNGENGQIRYTEHLDLWQAASVHRELKIGVPELCIGSPELYSGGHEHDIGGPEDLKV